MVGFGGVVCGLQVSLGPVAVVAFLAGCLTSLFYERSLSVALCRIVRHDEPTGYRYFTLNIMSLHLSACLLVLGELATL